MTTDAERVKAAIEELMSVEKFWPVTPEDMAISRALAVLRGHPPTGEPPQG